ncbi:M48 family metallopeptidase [Actinosynnema mirum]|uniref:Peptidase M48 Ste24p n=1 Tax=Actinosynnema mirum (strain ATCC 29888 / DSM 43827 / JCM 3225 / NBRC 14064 / NCIMB 13271 / NRRL B-12336 / IMRU 3971 / 101) TaxID=446462 RepID=C6WHV3_ACTMD|nr:M48 family metallopeptidase [Actinosynnema mirum]ACU34404.1 peptidase M48 Ste24p [Actinosynnema mirum DSM 43827]
MRAVLAVGLLIGFFVLFTALTVGLCALTVYGFATGREFNAIKIALIAVPLVLILISALYKALKARGEVEGAPLTREAQPGLWAVVDELAAVAGTRGPDEIRLVGAVNAAVSEQAPMLGLRAGRRTLLIGLPLLAGLTASELRSVLAHELGHYGGGHTKLSALTYRAKEALVHVVDGLDDTFLQRPFAWYAKLYARVAASVNRRQELDADTASVTAAGREAAQSALRKLPVLGAAWNGYQAQFLSLGAQAELTPPVMAGFHAYLSEPERRGRMDEARAELLAREPESVFDSHPPIRERVGRMATLPSPEVERDDRPAWTLLSGATADLERSIMVGGGFGPTADWDEVVSVVAREHGERRAGLLAVAGARAGLPGEVSLDDALAALASTGQRDALLGHLLSAELLGGEVPEEQRAQVLAGLLGAVLEHELVAAGVGAYEADWDKRWVVRLEDGRAVDGPPLFAEVLGGPERAAEAWKRAADVLGTRRARVTRVQRIAEDLVVPTA